MNKYWIMIVVAAIFEVGWVIGLKYSESMWHYLLTGVAIFFSFYFLIKATQHLSVGTGYAVFVGLGTFGTVTMDTLLFGGSLSLLKLVFVALLLIGVIGLKLLAGSTERR